jgi:hypothetical protein
MRQPGDTAESRAAGRGRTWYKTLGMLPVEWEEITSVCVERQVYEGEPPRKVVLGRIIRPLRLASSDVTVPQAPTTQFLPCATACSQPMDAPAQQRTAHH